MMVRPPMSVALRYRDSRIFEPAKYWHGALPQFVKESRFAVAVASRDFTQFPLLTAVQSLAFALEPLAHALRPSAYAICRKSAARDKTYGNIF